jgi:hypothetical protein
VRALSRAAQACTGLDVTLMATGVPIGAINEMCDAMLERLAVVDPEEGAR